MKSLPPLETVFPSKLTQENKSAELFDRLRTLTLSLKEDHSRPFYSIRQIARHTGESATLVARAYRKLELEGHLLILRSKETLVSGKKIHPLYAIKGVIGFPVWGYGFFHIHDLRSFYLSLINHLKKTILLLI